MDVEPTYRDTTDNAPLQATVILPKPREDGRLPPLIAMIHGGPHSSNSTYFHATLYGYLASLGFAIVSPNYRGSIVRCSLPVDARQRAPRYPREWRR